MMASPSRRRFLLGALLAAAMPASRARDAALPDRAGVALARWQPGWLDIHHIATGRGNATFILLPDGSSLLIDAGASLNGADVSVAPMPSSERRPGEWIARYISRQMRAAGLEPALDYLLVSHLHPDHLGDVNTSSPVSRQGSYRLGGVTDVAELLPVKMLVDRDFPDYSYPALFSAPFLDNYKAYVTARRQAGLPVQRFQVGSNRQIAPRNAGAWEIRNIAANGEVWTGQGDSTRQLFPALDSIPRADWPNENQCSAAIRLGYGRFSYFTAGDLTSYTEDGALPWRDVLGPAARVAGRVSAATADHHGMFDGLSADVVRALAPQVWVVPTWHISHPDMLQLERMFSQRLYPGARDVFATSVMKENLLANGRLTKRMRSHDGHVVVRVAPGGAQFHVAVTDNRDEQDQVKLVTGPYIS